MASVSTTSIMATTAVLTKIEVSRAQVGERAEAQPLEQAGLPADHQADAQAC